MQRGQWDNMLVRMGRSEDRGLKGVFSGINK